MKKGGRRRGGWSTSFVEMRKTEEEIWREGWESGFGLAKFRILLDSELNFSYWIKSWGFRSGLEISIWESFGETNGILNHKTGWAHHGGECGWKREEDRGTSPGVLQRREGGKAGSNVTRAQEKEKPENPGEYGGLEAVRRKGCISNVNTPERWSQMQS